MRGQVKRSETGRPLITIITSTYNAAELLPETIESIRRQTYDNIEYIVVDGASTDGTIDLLKQNDDLISYWLSEPDTGIYHAWNKALELAHGEWILFVGAGDRLGWGWIESVVENGEGFDLVYGDLELSGLIDDNSKKIMKTILKGVVWESARAILPLEMPFPHAGAAHHQRLFQHRRFDESYKIIGDWEFLTRADPLRGCYVPEKVQAHMVFGGKSTHPASTLEHYGEILRSLKSRNIREPIKMKIRRRIKCWLLIKFPVIYRWMRSCYWRMRTVFQTSGY